MPRLNRVDPFGDLHRAPERGLFTGNRGCLVDEHGVMIRHHTGNLWITCVTRYKDWKSPLDQSGHWTPLFFLDDAVALAAGHRPCGLCRRDEYLAYRTGVQRGRDLSGPPKATEINAMLAQERLRWGRGMSRAADRKPWSAVIETLPSGTVIVEDGVPLLVTQEEMFAFSFSGWIAKGGRPETGEVSVLTPPTSVLALAHGYEPTLHASASRT